MSAIYTAVIDGKTVNLKLVQEAYLAGTNTAPYYEAAAIDADDVDADISMPTHMIKWEITAENFDEVEDQSEACDWNKFTVEAL